jgi:hypothetical protein
MHGSDVDAASEDCFSRGYAEEENSTEENGENEGRMKSDRSSHPYALPLCVFVSLRETHFIFCFRFSQ